MERVKARTSEAGSRLQLRRQKEQHSRRVETSPPNARARRRSDQQAATCVERLHNVTGVHITVADVLQEILPNQKNILAAAPLVFNAGPQRAATAASLVTSQSMTRLTMAHVHTSPRSRTGFNHRQQQRPKDPRGPTALTPLPDASAWSNESSSSQSCPRRTESSTWPSSQQTHDNPELQSLSLSAEVRVSDRHRVHTLHLWEDKFMKRALSTEDTCFLLLRDDVVAIVESAVFLRASQLTNDQLMELEMAWEQVSHKLIPMSHGKGDNSEGYRMITSSTQPQSNGCRGGNVVTRQHCLHPVRLLYRNVWLRGSAFYGEHADNADATEDPTRHVKRCREFCTTNSPRKQKLRPIELYQRSHSPKAGFILSAEQATASSLHHDARKGWLHIHGPPQKYQSPFIEMGETSPYAGIPNYSLLLLKDNAKHQLPVDRPGSQDEYKRLSYEYTCSHRLRVGYDSQVLVSSNWLRDHCVDELLQIRHVIPCEIRRRFAVEKLFRLWTHHVITIQSARFARWQRVTCAKRCLALVQQYCSLKGAQLMLVLARRQLARRLLRRWRQWREGLDEQHELERLAALVALQSWLRALQGRQRARLHHVNGCSTWIQSAWRGWQCRRLLTRYRRFQQYSKAASIAQRAFRTHLNRVRFSVCWARHRAAWCLTRSLRRYACRRRLFHAWSRRVALFRAAALIQCWIRVTLCRVREAQAMSHRRRLAAAVLLRFFRYARFVCTFTGRLRRVQQRRVDAAVFLQASYRAKMARMRFYALQDRLEEQRRRELLALMWRNAYATTLQRWWRRWR